MGDGEKYKFVQRIGGAGDAGRDIEARYTLELSDGMWDLFQAKHYTSAIGESTLYPELAKVIHHISIKTYPSPNFYYVCAPKNTTPKLHDLIAKPDILKIKFQQSWTEGKYGIDPEKFPLTKEALDILRKFDFSKIKEYPIKDLIDLHSKNHLAHEILFGVESTRGDNPAIPELPTSKELIYINQLLKVYSEHGGSDLTLDHALKSVEYGEHLSGCRGEFYSAEGLKRLSRDVFPGEFERFLTAVLDGIKRVSASPVHKTGMDRLELVLERASNLQITNNPLSRRLLPADLPGACHQLVNEEKLKWVK
ncbi:ABC-three component system protein [Pseudomonas matsuisoli]|nr:ABC-three component system protein [Pseudomonas matsuisoli]